MRKGISDVGCHEAFGSIFRSTFTIPCLLKSYAPDTLFFRARPLSVDTTMSPYHDMSNIADAWEPPKNYVKAQGRLNAVSESVLYCCPGNPQLAIDEARARNCNRVAIMVYRSKKQITNSVIGNSQEDGLQQNDFTKIFFEFVEEEFSRDVPIGQEDIYSISRMIAQDYFRYPKQDAWCYRSVQSNELFNLAFLPNRAQECLDLVGVLICDPSTPKAGPLLIKDVVEFDPATGRAIYHKVGSVGQKKLFPDIS